MCPMVEDEARQGGRVLVIPARTMGEGPERKFLSGLEYELGIGFAPHPKFVQRMEEQIKKAASGSSTIPHPAEGDQLKPRMMPAGPNERYEFMNIGRICISTCGTG